jgi:hypothetical protein
MSYSLEEQLERGKTAVLGEPFFDLIVAKVIASRRALRTGRTVVVRDAQDGFEVVRYAFDGPIGTSSVTKMRSVESFDAAVESSPRSSSA